MSHIGAYADEPRAVDDYTLAPSVKLSITSCLDGNCSDVGEDSTVSGTSLATVGQTVYSRVYGLSVDAVDVEEYALTMNSNSENGELVGTQGDIVATAGGKQASEIDKDTWGYILLDGAPEGVTQASLASAEVAAMPGAEGSTEIASGKGNGVNTAKEELTSTKSIAFAAKFGDEAATGHYSTAVTLSLTASPKTVGAKGFGGVYYMQDLTADICKSVDLDTPGELEDKRDGKIYTVARIKNAANAGSNREATANCWMTSNLAFDLRVGGKADGAAVVLDPTTSDVTRKWPDADSSMDTDKAEAALQNGNFTNSATNLQYSNNGTGNDTWNSNSDKYGFYYSWCAATANSCGDSTADNGTAGKRSASQSICPKGWKLPTGGDGGEYKALLGSSSWATVNKGTKYNFYPAGRISSSGASGIGSGAYYWSSTSNSGTNAYAFNYDGTMYPAFSNGRYVGQSVRCVVEVEPTLNEINYMQEMTPEICSKITVGDTQYTLIDRRDGASYTFARFKDNNCWMTQNLRIIGKEISGADSDLPFGNTFTIPASNITGFKEMSDTDGYAAKAYYNNNTTYGAYYNWFTATAGAGTESVETNDTVMKTSICPKGWKLPTGGSSGQFQALATAIGTSRSTWMGSPYNFVYAGEVSVGSLINSTTYGFYWSRTVRSSDTAYYLLFYSNGSDVNPAADNYRYYGFSVRCVAATSADVSAGY